MRLRLKKLVKHGLQTKMIAVFLGLACISGCFQLILVNRSLMQLVRESQLLESGVAEKLPGILTANFLWTLAFLVPLMGYVGLLMTQRIAGPVYRFEKYLDSFVAGEQLGPCKIRKGDELQELCDRINLAIEKARRDARAPRAAAVASAGSPGSAQDSAAGDGDGERAA